MAVGPGTRVGEVHKELSMNCLLTDVSGHFGSVTWSFDGIPQLESGSLDWLWNLEAGSALSLSSSRW